MRRSAEADKVLDHAPEQPNLTIFEYVVHLRLLSLARGTSKSLELCLKL